MYDSERVLAVDLYIFNIVPTRAQNSDKKCYISGSPYAEYASSLLGETGVAAGFHSLVKTYDESVLTESARA